MGSKLTNKWESSAGAAEILDQLDAWTKEGKRLTVLRELEASVRAKPGLLYLPRLARLANRNHAYILALRALHPVIRDDREGIRVASPEAQGIYATSLLGIGALEEAEQHLCLARTHTEFRLTEAFLHFARWDYEASIPSLTKYIHSPEISPYQKVVGQVNLLAAFIAIGRMGVAREVLARLKPTLEGDTTRKILYGNCLELEAQVELQEGRHQEASTALASAHQALSDQSGRYLLYVNKWRAVLDLTLNPGSDEARASLNQVRREALQLRNWETIRDCDFHLARLTENQELLNRVLLGTPYRGFQDRVKRLYGIERPLERRLVYCPGDVSSSVQKIGLDLDKVAWKEFFSPTAWPLIQLLIRDIYRPPRLGVVFSSLYQGEFFDPFSSPQRVRNSIFRFNEWAKASRTGFQITCRQGDYILKGPAASGVACTSRPRTVERWSIALQMFRRVNGPRTFTAKLLANTLGISRRSAHQILVEALRHLKVQKIGHGRNTRYLLFSGRRKKRTAA